MCSPRETADQEGTEGTLLFFPAHHFLTRGYVLFANIYQLCSGVQCARASFPGPQLPKSQNIPAQPAVAAT
jgi:hypothetical protein